MVIPEPAVVPILPAPPRAGRAQPTPPLTYAATLAELPTIPELLAETPGLNAIEEAKNRIDYLVSQVQEGRITWDEGAAAAATLVDTTPLAPTWYGALAPSAPDQQYWADIIDQQNYLVAMKRVTWTQARDRLIALGVPVPSNITEGAQLEQAAPVSSPAPTPSLSPVAGGHSDSPPALWVLGHVDLSTFRSIVLEYGGVPAGYDYDGRQWTAAVDVTVPTAVMGPVYTRAHDMQGILGMNGWLLVSQVGMLQHYRPASA